MASYADDHASYAAEQTVRSDQPQSSRLSRNDPLLSSFFSDDRLAQIPTQELFTGLAQALENHGPESNSLMARMVMQLFTEAAQHDSGKGVDQEFLDSLDRVSKSSIKEDDACPICATPYLDDKYPLVVSLKCRHSFDLECITPWLRLHTTCPMCRAEVTKARQVIVEPDSEEEYDDTYG